MTDELQRARDNGDESEFDAELDGFSVDPDPDAVAIVADVLKLAKDAPTSFEPEQWLEGFEDGRKMIAERVALVLKQANIVGFDYATFLTTCDVGFEPCTQHTDTGRGVCADCQEPIEGSRYA
jgi:hypothetical protein